MGQTPGGYSHAGVAFSLAREGNYRSDRTEKVSRAEKISVGVAVFGAGVTVVFGALSRGDVPMSAVLVTLVVGFGIVLMVGGSGFAATSWLMGRRDSGTASQPANDSPPLSPPSSHGSQARPSRQVRRAEENKPQRPVPPTVPAPPALSSTHPARAGLARALRVLATEGDELASDPDAPRESQAEAREERKRWARKVRETLENAALLDHASYFFEATARSVSPRNWLQDAAVAMKGGQEEIKSGWRLEERLAKLRRIIAQIEGAG